MDTNDRNEGHIVNRTRKCTIDRIRDAFKRYILRQDPEPLHGTMPSDLNEVSQLLCRLLDSGGYSQDMIERRRNKYSGLISYTGSKAEGLTHYYESDTDLLMYIRTTTCVNDPALIDVTPTRKTILQVRNVHPGYCILEDVSGNKYYDPRIKRCLVEFRGKTVVSSSLFVKQYRGKANGPAQTISDVSGDVDYVNTLSCECSSLMEQFIQRQRHYNWPPSDVLQFMKNKRESANLVATSGKNDSDTEEIEWRYCFNGMDLLLVKSLNETQTKLYIVLKMINKDILKKNGFTLTSFIMKNIVYWLAESNPQDSFQPDSLFKWVLEGLKMLQNVVDQNELKYFMIPERNLFTEKVKKADRERLKTALTDLINEGPRMLLKCVTISKLIALTTGELAVFKRKLRELELYNLHHFPRYGSTFSRYPRRYIIPKHRMLLSGWPTPIQRQIDQCGRDKKAVIMLLS